MVRLTNEQNALLVSFLHEDRQWKRHNRIKYARTMRNKLKFGVHFRSDPRYDEAFWNSVLHHLNYDEQDKAWNENNNLTPWSYQPPMKVKNHG